MIINAIKDGVGITGGGTKPPVLEQLSATENGTYTPSDGVDGFSPVEVNVQPPLQTKAIEITANGQSTIEADSEYYGLDSVNLNINVPIPTFQTEELSVASNGTYTPSTDGYSKVTVNVQPKLQAKATTTTITANGTNTISVTPDSNYDGLSSASVTITTNVEASGGGSTPTIYITNGTKLCLPDNNGEVSDLSGISIIGLTTMANMFDNSATAGIVNINGWDTSNVTDMRYTFHYCKKLTSLDIGGWNVSNVTNMDSMFDGCTNITSIDLSNWNVSNVTNMGWMFNSCSNLTSIDLSTWNMNNVTNMSYMFNGCKVLTDLNMNGAILPKIDLTNWGLDTCTALTVDSLVSVINALPQLDSGTSYTCTIGSTNLAKLTDEQKAIATNKGWTLN